MILLFAVADPWVGGRGKKKAKKGKPAAKKPSSTQDKISLLIEQKSSAHKKVLSFDNTYFALIIKMS